MTTVRARSWSSCGADCGVIGGILCQKVVVVVVFCCALLCEGGYDEGAEGTDDGVEDERKYLREEEEAEEVVFDVVFEVGLDVFEELAEGLVDLVEGFVFNLFEHSGGEDEGEGGVGHDEGGADEYDEPCGKEGLAHGDGALGIVLALFDGDVHAGSICQRRNATAEDGLGYVGLEEKQLKEFSQNDGTANEEPPLYAVLHIAYFGLKIRHFAQLSGAQLNLALA